MRIAPDAGMVISVETTMLHPQRGFIQARGYARRHEGRNEMFATEGRWNPGAV